MPTTGASDTLVLYHADWGRSCRAILLLRLLEVPFTLKVVEWPHIKDEGFMATTSPLGRIPVMFDGEVHLWESGVPLTLQTLVHGKELWPVDQDQESASLAPDGVWVAVGAMVEYLLHKHGPGKLKVPQGGRQYADYLQWFHTAEAMMSAVVQVFFCKVIPALRTPERVEPATKAVQGVLQMLENYLSTRHKGEWLAGPEFTAADIMMSSTLGLLDFSCQSPTEVPAILTSDKYPVAAAYWDRLQALPEYKDCYEDINLLPEGEHLIEPGKSFNDAPKCQPTVTLEMNL